MKKHRFNPAIWIFPLIISCNSHGTSVFEKINTFEKGDFGDASIHTSPGDVKQKKMLPPKNEESDYLYYEIPLNEHKEYYTVGYSFNEKGLYEILWDVYLNKPEDALQLYEDMKDNFISRYGNPQQEDETTIVWTIKNEKSEAVEVTLSDESIGYNSGKISVSFYDLAY